MHGWLVMPIRIGYNLPQKWFASIGTRQPLDHRNVNNEIFATENKLIIKLLFSLTILLRNNELYHWFCFLIQASHFFIYYFPHKQTNSYHPWPLSMWLRKVRSWLTHFKIRCFISLALQQQFRKWRPKQHIFAKEDPVDIGLKVEGRTI